MRVPLSWLREFCPVDLGPEEVAELLTRQGVHVEAVLRPWEGLSGVVVARVVEVTDHPGSDRLCLARVRAGEAERQVVVGVRNMRPGDLVPLAPPGATLPGLSEPLAAREIRGVVSEGMLCSPRELGISQDHSGILVLPEEAPPGSDLKQALGLDEAVLDIEVKPNRPDLLSVVGVAREVAAGTGAPFVEPDTSVGEGEERAAELATVEVLDLVRCPRYLARVVRGVRVGPSPLRVQARLTAAGMRPLSNVVDATNYVMLELGQPLHPFDLARLEGRAVVVRRAEPGERLVTLDGVERALDPDDLLIADRSRGVAVAGVMGSAAAEVSDSTTDVLLESANFERTGVLRTARRLGLRTEASLRFERGVDPELVPLAAARAARLMVEWAGGSVAGGAVEVGGAPPRRRLSLRPERASLLIGMPVSGELVLETFRRLRVPARERDGAVEVEVPGYRVDLELEADLVEEVARLYGYDRVPARLPPVRRPGGLADSYAARRRVREALVRAGLREASTFSFASAEDLALMGVGEEEAVRVANPLAADQAFLRTSLVPGLLRALQYNLARQVRGAALFEVGRVFRRADPVEERDHAGVALCGQPGPAFPGEAREVDFFDAKGSVEVVLEALGLGDWALEPEPLIGPYHPVRSAAVVVDGARVGSVGELHPRVAARLDLPPGTAVAELDVTALSARTPVRVAYRDLPRFPPVRRDLAFVVDRATPAGAVRAAILEAAGGLADQVTLFDVFTGPPVPEGRKSLAFSVDFRAPDRTLTDEETERAVAAIVARLRERFGAELRAG
ncbi:MAG TPA: phenylalanine--tRNA ligase subunit beta [Actinomycetota bacterium]|nr:phenylalanine--tRNA ligase subunit beta [Actinomycetota bacterium]